MRVASNVRRLVAAGATGALLAGCGGASDVQPPATTVVDASAALAEVEAVPDDPRFVAAGRTAARRLARARRDDAWAVPDAVSHPLDRLWDTRVGAYVSAGGRVSTRLNAELLRIHAAAAQAGHQGPARHDDRVRRIAAYLTGPAYVASAEGQRFGASRHNAVHVPGWRQSSAPVVDQHPSIDAVVARSLRAAWLARSAAGLPPDTLTAIRRTVVAVASSPAFRAPARLLNQINWNADLYAAAATVTGDPALLRRDYREQLGWFLDHASTPIAPGALSNLTAGGGFRYQPAAGADSPLNGSDTVEYASIVVGALRYYDEALAAGMRPLDPEDRATASRWATHTLEAGWTPSGYLNWETGKASSRLHLRQYWALALDGAVSAARGGQAATGLPAADGDRLLSRGTALFRRWAREGGSVLLPGTSFGYPSRFAGVRENRTTATARLAATLAEWASECGCGGRLPDPATDEAPLVASLDPEIHRLAVNGPRYATAISPTAKPTGGGLEPGWILDAHGAALGPLGGGGSPALGVRLSRGGRAVLDTQPGPTRAAGLTLRPVPRDRRAFVGRVDGPGATVRVTHRFLRDRIVTRYALRADRPVDVTVRISSAGVRGTVRCAPDSVLPERSSAVPGCPSGRDYLVRSAGGASMHVAFTGLPGAARVRLGRPPATTAAPRPGTQATLRFRLDGRTTITRVLRPDAG